MLEESYKQQIAQSIPIINHLGIEIRDISSRHAVLAAPLDKNINYEGTAFGGSINTVAILSCYLMTHHFMRINEISFKSLVIQDSSIQYLKPVDGDFYARCESPNEYKVQQFLRTLNQKKIARLELHSNIFRDCDGPHGPDTVHAKFVGRFVAGL